MSDNISHERRVISAIFQFYSVSNTWQIAKYNPGDEKSASLKFSETALLVLSFDDNLVINVINL